MLTCDVQSNNSVGAEGAKAIAKCLKVNSTLQTLDLVSIVVCSFQCFMYVVSQLAFGSNMLNVFVVLSSVRGNLIHAEQEPSG